ncbi:MAG: type II toxin-antitoxin system Phd/YefM family antitoxin [Candidatus Binatia bacterium]
MKRVTASEARKQWFRLLDEAAAGEVIVLERKGRRLVLRREEGKSTKPERNLPNYKKLLRVPDADQADQWGWVWEGPEEDLILAVSETK